MSGNVLSFLPGGAMDLNWVMLAGGGLSLWAVLQDLNEPRLSICSTSMTTAGAILICTTIIAGLVDEGAKPVVLTGGVFVSVNTFFYKLNMGGLYHLWPCWHCLFRGILTFHRSESQGRVIRRASGRRIRKEYQRCVRCEALLSTKQVLVESQPKKDAWRTD